MQYKQANFATILQYTCTMFEGGKFQVSLPLTHNIYLNTGYKLIYKV